MNELPQEIENSDILAKDEKLLAKFRRVNDPSVARELFRLKCENYAFDFDIVYVHKANDKDKRKEYEALTRRLFKHLLDVPSVKLQVLERGTQRANNITRKLCTYFKKHRDITSKVSVNLNGTLEYRETDGNLRQLQTTDYAMKYVDICGNPDFVYLVI